MYLSGLALSVVKPTERAFFVEVLIYKSDGYESVLCWQFITFQPGLE